MITMIRTTAEWWATGIPITALTAFGVGQEARFGTKSKTNLFEAAAEIKINRDETLEKKYALRTGPGRLYDIFRSLRWRLRWRGFCGSGHRLLRARLRRLNKLWAAVLSRRLAYRVSTEAGLARGWEIKRSRARESFRTGAGGSQSQVTGCESKAVTGLPQLFDASEHQ